MKKLAYLFLFTVILAISACNSECIKGSGNQKTEERSIPEFSKIEFEGNIKLTLYQDDNTSMNITSDDNILKEIKTSVDGDVLKIKIKGNYCDLGPIEIVLHTKKINKIDASGSAEINSATAIKSDNFELDLSGNSNVNLELVTGRLDVQSSGSAAINLKGQARENNLEMSGSTQLEAFDLVVGDYNIKSSGSSDCKINVLNSLNVKSSGASNIQYKGNPKTVNNDKSGSSDLVHIN
ncbi:DUF2807 domain-containing protein [Pedobacter sp. SD-b]|uniref:DUF2807 domain-containing protein n=1 Tax=Pedobacter segetis TaxID=2793069 RepID=A0ABS1BKL9_9SPHI|nr:head GIN domain-containing protein [Pedobacter segetis]MBK0383434.1 DUF2807 domain-containing protein [Pedobacter segetis]